MFTVSAVIGTLTNALLGLLGIEVAWRQRGRSRLVFRLMMGSCIVLCLPTAWYLVSLPAARFGLWTYGFLGGHGLAQVQYWMRWLAHALLLFGFVYLRTSRRRAASDSEAHSVPAESVIPQPRGKTIMEAVVGGVVIALTGGLVGLLVAGLWAPDTSDMSRYVAYPCAVLGLALGVPFGIGAGKRAFRSGVGAHPRFWFPVFALCLGAVVSVYGWSFVAPLLSQQPDPAWQDYCLKVFPQFALVFPFVCGLIGFLISLRLKKGFTGWFVTGCLLLVLGAASALPSEIARARTRPLGSKTRRPIPEVPAFLRYPGVPSMTGLRLSRTGSGAMSHVDIDSSRESVLDFYKNALVGWESLPVAQLGAATSLAYVSADGKQLVEIVISEHRTSHGTSLTVIYNPNLDPTWKYEWQATNRLNQRGAERRRRAVRK